MTGFARLSSVPLQRFTARVAVSARARSGLARSVLAVALLVASGPATSLVVAGCDISFQNTRMARGQLAVVGMNPYDDYFKKVHAEQVAGAA